MSQSHTPATDQFLDIADILKEFNSGSSRNNSLYQIEDYIKTLPDMIPEASRRDILAKIISASNIEKGDLVGDGEKRLELLGEYAKNFSSNTDALVFSRLDEIDQLNERISNLRKEIKARHELQEKQIGVINNEVQRIKSIMSFLSAL